MNIKCVLFDVDGVLVHTKQFSYQYCELYDISIDKMLPFFKGDFQEALVGRADLLEIVKPWLPKWKWSDTPEKFLRKWFELENHVDQKVIAIVDKLRSEGIKCYVATNQEKHRTRFMSDGMGFGELFDGIFSSANIGFTKPDKRYYEFILKELNKEGIASREIFYFDDSEKNIVAADLLGINARLYEKFADLEREMAILSKGG